MDTWQASNARLKFADIFDSAAAGHPQLVQRRDGKAVVVVSQEYYEKTKPNLKSFFLEEGYSGPGEDAFDAIMRGVRASTSDVLRPRRPDAAG